MPDPLRALEAEGAGGDRLLAPMPGRIVSVEAEAGAVVTRGQVLVLVGEGTELVSCEVC